MSLLLLLREGEGKETEPKSGNLIENPSFEDEALDWGSLSSAVLSRTTEDAHSGAAALKVECKSHSSFEGAVHGITEDFTPGERYQYVAWVKGPAGKTLRIRLEDDEGRDETFFESTGDWRRVSVRRTIDPAATFIQIGVHVGGTQTTTFFVDDVDLELAPTEFIGNWESGDLSEWDLIQAIPGRVTVTKSNPAQGLYCGRFEVQQGDVEPATGSNRAEVQSGLEYQEGQKRYFRIRGRIPHASWDWDHWGLIWQIHDDSTESPPLCLMLGKDPETGVKQMALQSGDSKHTYWTHPVPDDQWFELIPVVEFGKEGSVGCWLNRRRQTMLSGKAIFEGIDTLGNPFSYDKLGVYRSKESVGTAVVYHDDYRVSATPFTFSRIAVTRELPPDKLAVRIADPNTSQTIARWAEDEPKAENVVADLRKNGEMSGGHKEMTCSLARDPRVDYPDLGTYNDVYVEQPGGENVWEGRLEKKPKSDGERLLIGPGAVGHQAALEDRKGIIGPGFIDQDLTKWGDMSTQRRLDMGFMAPVNVETGSGGTGEALPAIMFVFERLAEHWMGNESWYYGGGVDIGELLFNFRGTGEDSAWNDFALLSSDDFASGYDASSDYEAKLEVLNQALTATQAGRKYAAFQTARDQGESTLDPYTGIHRWEIPKVLGTHGLTPQGTWPDIGFTSGQMLRYAIPLYTYLEATEESVEDEGYVIPQAWFSDSGMMAQVVQELTKYELLDWFVLHGKLFEQRIPGTYGRRWQAYSGPSELEQTGEDGSRLWDRIMVRYTDVDGSTRTVGYPGSGATIESAALQITDPDHPAVKASKVREDLLDLKGISTPAGAEGAGERWLADANELSRSGSAKLRGYVMDDKGILRPVAQVQPGDWIRFPDDPDRDYRKIVLPDYDDPSKTCDVALDAPSESLQALLERYQAVLTPLGLS